ncbi:MAG: glycosyltransferase [Gammaproteobacteria bacterium]|nr:glycosyltransferase [Gammaproteobacteria bacterium]
MRILMISDVYFPRINGVSTSIATYRDSFRALGHEITLLAPAYPADYSDDADTVRIPSRGLPLDPEDRMMHYRVLVTMREALRGRAFDIVHIQTPFVAHYAGIRIARALGLPVIESYHTYFEEYLYHYIPMLPRGSLRVLARRFSAGQGNAVDALVVPSHAMHDKLRGYGVRSEMRIIPTGLNMQHFTRGDGAAFRRRLGIDPGRPVLLFVGRVAFEKNIDFLLHMVNEVRQRLPDVLLLIAGEGPAEPHLRRLTERLGLGQQVAFVGYLDRESALLDCYAAADVFVFSSRTETQGLVLLEAMAMGRPVVAQAVMGTRDVLREGEGALIAEDDVRDFAHKVLTLLRNRRLYEQLSRRALDYARTWSNESCARKLEEYYVQIIDKAAAARRALEPHHAQR